LAAVHVASPSQQSICGITNALESSPAANFDFDCSVALRCQRLPSRHQLINTARPRQQTIHVHNAAAAAAAAAARYQLLLLLLLKEFLQAAALRCC
jgi:hypothetical protein